MHTWQLNKADSLICSVLISLPLQAQIRLFVFRPQETVLGVRSAIHSQIRSGDVRRFQTSEVSAACQA
jgi:hypothetical protein